MTTPTVAQYICSQAQTEHADQAGRCQDPTRRCECAVYSELCAQCSHGYDSHDGTNGICTRIKQKTRMPCGCTQYPTDV